MKSFCMPADFKKETIDGYDRLNHAYDDSRVAETYGNITVANCFGSGRDVGKLPKVSLAELRDYVAYSLERDIEFSYTINASYMGNKEFQPEGVAEIRAFLRQLRDAGVTSLTIALPSLIEIVRDMNLGFRIKASTICQVTNANKAMFFKNMGVHGVVPDETLNRDFHALKRIRVAFGENVELIVNSVCHQDCHYRMFHYNQISGDSVDKAAPVSCAYYPLRCQMRLYEDVSSLLKVTWIRPEDLHYYTEIGISVFKLQGRQTALHGDPVRAVECYFRGRYDGDLKDLLFLFAPSDFFKLSVENRKLDGFLKPFVETEGFCRRDCSTCDYCETFARQCFDYDRTAERIRSTRAVLVEQDPFKKMLADTA